MRSRENSTTDFSFRFKDGAGITLVVMARMRKGCRGKVNHCTQKHRWKEAQLRAVPQLEAVPQLSQMSFLRCSPVTCS